MVIICLPLPPSLKSRAGCKWNRRTTLWQTLSSLSKTVTGSWLDTNDQVILAVLLIDGDTSQINSACHYERQWPTGSWKWLSYGQNHWLQRSGWSWDCPENSEIISSTKGWEWRGGKGGCCLRKIYGRNTTGFWSWKGRGLGKEKKRGIPARWETLRSCPLGTNEWSGTEHSQEQNKMK